MKQVQTDLKIYTDGGSRGNPGQAAYGFVVYNKNNEIIHKEGGRLGIQTNNYAEYSAVLKALEWVSKSFTNEKVTVSFFLDSLLVASQLSGTYKLKNPNLKSLFIAIKALSAKALANKTYTNIPREKNKEADRMVNIALDGKD